MKKKVQGYFSRSVFTLGGILLGFVIAESPKVKFADEIDPSNFANFVLTIVLALAIALYFEPAKEKQKLEKDLMIEQLKQVKDSAKTINDLVSKQYLINPLTQDSKTEIVAYFRILSNQYSLFLDQLEYTGTEGLEQQVELMRTHIFEMKRAVTGGAFMKADFFFASKPHSFYDKPYTSLLKLLNRAIFDINNI